MKKSKSKKQNILSIFLILFLTVPFIWFLFLSLKRFIYSSSFNYGNNFIYFFETVKSYKEFLFPAIIFLTVGLAIILLVKLFSKKTTTLFWIMLSVLGVIIILFGSRILFLIFNNVPISENFNFIFNGVDEYNFLFSLEITFLLEAIIEYFSKFLNK